MMYFKAQFWKKKIDTFEQDSTEYSHVYYLSLLFLQTSLKKVRKKDLVKALICAYKKLILCL